LIEGLPDDVAPVFLKGNHEDMLLTFLERPGFGLNWLHNGGDMALLSYGVEVEVIRNAYWHGAAALVEAANVFRSVLPKEHLDFFRALQLSYQAGDYFFAHAGVKPGVALDQQAARDLIWIRDEFLSYAHDFGAVVVHGHTPVRTPENLPNRIGIDTLAFHTGKLTAVGLEGTERWFLST
jgi:serine/threonine protein phosphatase 1